MLFLYEESGVENRVEIGKNVTFWKKSYIAANGERLIAGTSQRGNYSKKRRTIRRKSDVPGNVGRAKEGVSRHLVGVRSPTEFAGWRWREKGLRLKAREKKGAARSSSSDHR